MQCLIDEIKKENPTASTRHHRLERLHQIAQWVLMHEAERLALPALSRAQLVARLERALGQLGELPQPRREAWEDAIRSLLAAKDKADTEQLDLVYRAYLDELLGEIYEASNGNAIQLSGLYNRATWVILAALLPLGVLAGFGYGQLLVAGAIGGLVSRMQRLVFSTRIPITYGSSWAPLFCAPVLGALAAWAGLVLISLLQAVGVLQLTALDTSLDSLRHPSAALLGMAILLGVSERFLLRLEKQAEAVIDPDRAGPSDQAGRPTPPRLSSGNICSGQRLHQRLTPRPETTEQPELEQPRCSRTTSVRRASAAARSAVQTRTCPPGMAESHLKPHNR